MKSIFLILIFLIFIGFVDYKEKDTDYFSPIDIDLFDDGNKLLITGRTGKQLKIIDKNSRKVTGLIRLDQRASGAVVSEKGDRFYVTVGDSNGFLLVIDAESKKIKNKIKVGHSPNSPVVSKNGKIVYVCNRFDNSVSIVDLKKGKTIKTLAVKREPIAAEITPDGKLLFVANHLPDGRADVDYVASKVSVIDAVKNDTLKTIKLANGAEGIRGITISPDGKYVYATHLMARFQVPTTQIERGWMNTNALSVIRVEDQKLLYTVLLDDIDLGFANPWAVKISGDGEILCVTSAGNNEVRLINLKAMTQKIERKVSELGENINEMHLNIHNDLSFIASVSTRVSLEGKGSRSLLIDDNTIYIPQYFSDELCTVVIDENGEPEEVKRYELGKKLPLTSQRRGEIFFNDASLCFQKWQSCASCHSDDGRTDALNWDLLNDGIGNPKNVKSLLMSHQTPPVMALGVRAKAEVAVRAGIKYIQFAVRPEEDAVDMDNYLRSLKPVPSPYLVNGELSEEAKKGKLLFKKVGCINCHPEPLYTNMKSYNIHSGTGQDKGKEFDTPTLIEVWRTSPYMHDGRAVTIKEVIKYHKINNANVILNELNDIELNQLSKYVLSL